MAADATAEEVIRRSLDLVAARFDLEQIVAVRRVEDQVMIYVAKGGGMQVEAEFELEGWTGCFSWIASLDGPVSVSPWREWEPGGHMERLAPWVDPSQRERGAHVIVPIGSRSADGMRAFLLIDPRRGPSPRFELERLDLEHLPWLALLASHVHRALQVATLTQAVRARSVELEESNEQLQSSLADLEQTQQRLLQTGKMEAIGRLAGGVAHDFNNILTGILGYAEMLEYSLPPGHEGREFAAEIRGGGERAADLTRQLLAFARKQVIEPRVIRPNEVIAKSERMLGRLIGEDIALRFIPGDRLWNVRVDPTQLDQVLVNLAVNARDAMPSGGQLLVETANVVLEDEPHQMGDEPVSGEFVVLAVSDNGLGMDAATRDRIFEPFFSTKGPGLGTGLGLATVYGILSQNQGVVSVYSEPGHGTTFKLYLPAVRDAADDASRSAAQDIADGAETVLLVEDDTLVRELSRRVLTDHGYTVLEAENAEEALLLGRRFSGRIDLLLTDVVMPGMNGRELFELLHASRPDLQALFMSGYTENVVAHHGVLEEGMNFVQKPFTIEGLMLRVQDLLGRDD